MTDVKKAASLSEVLRVALDDHLAMHKRCVSQGGGSRGMSPDEAYEDGASEFHNDLQEMRGAIAKAAVCNEWQPIEDAPRDGTIILCYFPEAMEVHGQIHSTVFIQPPGKFSEGWWQLSRDYTKTHGFRMFGAPTHFRLIEGPG